MDQNLKAPKLTSPVGMASKYLTARKPWIESQQGSEDGSDWHELPIKPDFLARLLRMSALHESAIDFKARLVTMGYGPHVTNRHFTKPPAPNDNAAAVRRYWEKMYDFFSFFPLNDFYGFMHDYFTFGNSYLERIRNKGKTKIAGLRRRNGRLMRVLKQDKGYGLVIDDALKKPYTLEEIIHKFLPCSESDYYGLPAYTGAINDIILSDAARTQRIQFYDNNGYMGGIIVSNLKVDDVDKDGKSATEDKIVDDINTAQTPGKGRTVLLNLRGDDAIEDVTKVLTYIDTTLQLAKDDFKVTTDTATRSIYEAHQTPPELLGTVLEKKVSPDLNKLLANYYMVVIKPIADLVIQEINSEIDPENWIDLKPQFGTINAEPSENLDSGD
jgi:capsid portal protein